MKIYLALALLTLLMIGCSTSDVSQSSSSSEQNISDPEKAKQKAVEHFINGSIAESKGDYSSAIKEFNQALDYDTSAGICFALAKNYFAINKLGNALKYSKLSVQLDSTKTEYQLLLADVFIQARENDSAAVVLEKILAADSTDVNTYYKLARIYENTRPLEAIKIYDRLINIIGLDWNVLLRVAELYEKLGYKEKAAESVEGLLEIDPSNVALQKLAIDFYVRNGYNEKALVMLDEMIDTMPDDLEAREKRAQIFIIQNDWESASKEFKYIIEKPDVPLEAKVGIGATYFAKSFSDSTALPVAKEFFESIDKDTTDWQVKLYLGAIALNEGNDSLAIENFKYVTENASWHVESWIRLGGLYFDNRRYEDAETIMREAIELFPNDFAVNLILGLSLAQQNKALESKDYLKKAVELNPSDVNSLSAYGFTLSQLQENEEAVEYLKRALRVDPNNVNVLGQLGLIYNNLEMMAESDSLYEYALQIDPQNALINNNYAYSLSERDLHLDRALEMIEIAMAADSSNSSYLDTYGWIFFKLGEYDKAYFYIKKAIDVDGENNAVLLEHLGDVLFMQGKKEEALDLWKRALELDSSNETLMNKVSTGAI
ncbi:MAG TPA: tetratricopeptide repeat protein [Ignavibacteriaceae bacterium]|nr:tetratricopeptide repeat protein [Ignavibacteriaceae bacterium]